MIYKFSSTLSNNLFLWNILHYAQWGKNSIFVHLFLLLIKLQYWKWPETFFFFWWLGNSEKRTCAHEIIFLFESYDSVQIMLKRWLVHSATLY